MRPLANIRSGVVDDHFFYVDTPMELNSSPTFIHKSKREANVLEGAGNTDAALEVRLSSWLKLEIPELVLSYRALPACR